nr:hypothetical protein [Patescibacteria group bacterium]
WLHWSHIYRVKEDDTLGVPRFVWMRSDRDDWVHATVYWRVGIDRFGGKGGIVGLDQTPEGDSYMVNPNQTVDFNPDAMFGKQRAGEEPWWAGPEEDDWRNTG